MARLHWQFFAAISSAILRQVNYWRFRGNSSHRREIAAKIAIVNGTYGSCQKRQTEVIK